MQGEGGEDTVGKGGDEGWVDGDKALGKQGWKQERVGEIRGDLRMERRLGLRREDCGGWAECS